jgi:hypothetical protein
MAGPRYHITKTNHGRIVAVPVLDQKKASVSVMLFRYRTYSGRLIIIQEKKLICYPAISGRNVHHLKKLKEFPEASSVVEDIINSIAYFGNLSESGINFSVPKWNENQEEIFNMIVRSEPMLTRSDSLDISGLKKKYKVSTDNHP